MLSEIIAGVFKVLGPLILEFIKAFLKNAEIREAAAKLAQAKTPEEKLNAGHNIADLFYKS